MTVGPGHAPGRSVAPRAATPDDPEVGPGSTLVPTLIAGTVIGVTEAVFAVSFAALIFSGPLAVHLPFAIGFVLLGVAVLMVIVSALSSVRGVIASVQDIPAAVLALVAAALAVRLPAEDPATALTVVVAVAVTTFLAGVFFLLLGIFRLGGFIRFVPFPVVGGFLAGTGWLLLIGGTETVIETSLSIADLGVLLDAAILGRLAPAGVLAVVLLVIVRSSDRPLAMPAVLAAAFVTFHTVFALSGTSIAEGAEGGWLMGPFPQGSLLQPPAIADAAAADWSAIGAQLPSIATLLVISVLALLLCATGVELTVRQDSDLNRELLTTGLANLAAGVVGGMPGYHALSLTALAHQMWARTRLVGVLAGVVCLVVLLTGGTLLSLFPTFLVGGVLIFVGLAFLAEWLYDTWGRMPLGDYLVALVIVVVMATVGFLEGMMVGIGLAMVLFVVNYSRNDVVKHELSGATLRSKRDRPRSHRDALRDAGDHIEILELQGYLFFGTANELLDRVRERVQDPDRDRLAFLVVDFRRVSDLDISAVMSFTKIHQLAGAKRFEIVYTGLRGHTRRRLEQGPLALDEEVNVFPDLDRGLEWCEDRVLEHADVDESSTTVLSLPDVGGGEIMDFLDRLELEPGEVLLGQGESSDDVYFLESGQLTVELHGDDGPAIRLRTLLPGAVVGEASFYLSAPRTATVRSDEASTVLRLSGEAMAEMERSAPAHALEVHRLFAELLSARLADTLDTVNALLD